MNKDQVKGAAKQVEGEVKQQVGKLTGNTGTQARGHAKEAEGKVQKKVGDVKEAVRHEGAETDADIRKQGR